ncbi:MAG: DUF433 domain-containing protein [Ginsengibacter sp.]
MENLLNRITSSPDISFGKPVIRGTRMAVLFLMEHLAAGDTTEEILEEFPFLEKEDILACLQYATQLMNKNSISQIIKLPAA